jgi:glycosyltransferase involved in cell wall biosynthesis
LVITGEDRWGYLKRKRLENITNHNRIFFLGWVDLDDLVALYNLAHAFVFPSLYEGFGIPLLEAMACGCPILSSTAGAIPEIAEDAAVLVDPYDVDAIANGIVKIATDAKCRSSLQQRGFRRVEQFSWAKCARETLGVLESVVP